MISTNLLEPEKINIILATDCGSTTSKARFFRKVNGEYRYLESGEAPTTVEAPYEDVTFGVKNAIKEVEELTGHKILGSNGIITPWDGKDEGVDLYVTTSSAGGGLQMMVSGVWRKMTAESAERAALGAGAIVMEVLAIDDGLPVHQKIRLLRHLRPDMILMAGGTDGGDIIHVIQNAEIILASDPKARLGAMYELPIVFAGNINARGEIKKLVGKYALKLVDNLRPVLEVENVGPTREAVHELFMEHVMSHAPGYDKLMRWTPVPIMPTPAGEGMMFRMIGQMYNVNVIGVGLGGATTNIYSMFEGKFVRTVSANLGMSYSIGNVLKQTGLKNIVRWVPFEVDENDIRHRLYNKMIRPTTIPETIEDLIIEHAVAREALRMAFRQHKLLASPLRGALKEVKDLSTLFEGIKETYIDIMKIDWVGGTGGLLSHAPLRVQSAMILIDGFEPEGITQLSQDSVFMMPHLGVLSTVHPQAAMEIFNKDCLVRLGTVIGLKGKVDEKNEGKKAAEVALKMPDETTFEETITAGTITRIPLKDGAEAEAEIKPTSRFDVGKGGGHKVEATVQGGVAGILIDARGRPVYLPEYDDYRRKKLVEWFTALKMYQTVPEKA